MVVVSFSKITNSPWWNRLRETATSADRRKKIYKGMFLVLTPIIVLCICSTPTVIYFSLQGKVNGNATSSSVPGNCNKGSGDGDTIANCSLFSWGMASTSENPGNCITESYTGSVCRQQLLAWQECAVGSAGDVFLDLTLMEQPQEERERDAAQFLHFLDSFTSDYCQKPAAALLFCQGVFPLCDCSKSGHTYLASREECERISMVECEEEWRAAAEYGIHLPNCTDLPKEVTNSIVAVGSEGLPPLNVTNLTCSDDFFERNFTCLPHCDHWDERPQGALSTFDDVLRFTCGILDLLLNGFFLAAFIIRRKTMFVFPTVFLLYNGIGRFVRNSLEFIGAVGGAKLYCSSMDAIEAVASPTFYCIFQAAIGRGLLAFIIMTWLLHIIFLFYKIVFPLYARRTEPYFKRIHLCTLSVALVISAIVLIAGVASADSQFAVSSFPPFECSTKESNFYSSTLPPSTIAFFAFCMLAIICWVIHEQKVYIAEAKLIIVLAYYSLFIVFSYCQDAVQLAWKEPFENATSDYILCEAVGQGQEQCDRNSFEQYSYTLTLMNCFQYIITMFIPIVHLVYVFTIRNLSEFFQRLKIPKSLRSGFTKSTE